MATSASSPVANDESNLAAHHPLKNCYVWVTEPGKHTQHQAELLEVDNVRGYRVRWAMQNSVQWIPPSWSIVQLEDLPKRQRRRSSVQEEIPAEALPQSKPKLPPLPPPTPLPPTQQQQPSQRSQPYMAQPRQQHAVTKETNGVTSCPKKKRRRIKSSYDSCSSTDAESSVAEEEARRASPTGSPASDPFVGNAASDSLWKIHKVDRTAAEARLIKVLQPLLRSFSISSPQQQASMACKVGNLLLFALERQYCWVRRNNEGKQVWTDSSIFQQYFFCNVYRELDRGTCYFRSELCRYLDDRLHNGSGGGESNHYSNKRSKEDQAAAAVAANRPSSTPPVEQQENCKNTPVSPPLTQRRPRRRVDWIQQVLWASFCYRQVNRMDRFEDCFHGIPTMDQYSEFLDQVRLIQQEEYDRRKELEQSLLFTDVHKTPTYDEFIFNLSQLRRANDWLLKSLALRLEQAKTVNQCWEQIQRLPGLMDKHKKYPQVAWQVTCDLLESGCLPMMDHHNSAGGEDFCYFGSPAMSAITRIIAPHYNKSPIDQELALKFAKELVTKQNALFDALGVKFPKWVGNPISLKNMEHCMGQYNRYFLIISDTRRERSSPCHRLMLSRSFLDTNKSCRLCAAVTDLGLFCDCCLNFYCDKCEKDNFAASPTNWICNPCTELRQLRFHN